CREVLPTTSRSANGKDESGSCSSAVPVFTRIRPRMSIAITLKPSPIWLSALKLKNPVEGYSGPAGQPETGGLMCHRKPWDPLAFQNHAEQAPPCLAPSQ